MLIPGSETNIFLLATPMLKSQKTLSLTTDNQHPISSLQNKEPNIPTLTLLSAAIMIQLPEPEPMTTEVVFL
jgi:hypothetical protein